MHLQMDGEVTYNGHSFEDFVPERTAAYVNQYDEVGKDLYHHPMMALVAI